MGNSIFPTLFNKKNECCGCGACYAICPQRAIIMEEDNEGFQYPIINVEKCIKCLMCMKVCPLKECIIENE